MAWTDWIAIFLAFFLGAWMLFEGVRALITGDYTTPSSGEYAGQLGPWASLVAAVGIAPRSTLMKLVFVLLGGLMLISLLFFALGFSWGQWMLVVTAVLGLWYLPVGTVIDILIIILLLV